MKKIKPGIAARVTAGNLVGKVGFVTAFSSTLGTATIEIDGLIYQISAEYLDQCIMLQPKESDYHKWLNTLPDPQQWLEYQISEFNARFDGVNLLNVFDNDDDYKTLVMLRNTLAALKSARSNEEYYKRELQKERSLNSWGKNPDRMGQ